MTALGLLVFGTGVVLIYSGVRNEDPRDVLRGVLSGRPVAKPKPGTPAASGRSGLPGTGGGGSSGGGLGGGGGGSW